MTSGITQVIATTLPCLYLCIQFLCTSCNGGSESIGRQYVTACLGLAAVDCTACPFLEGCVCMHAFLGLGMEKTFLSWSCWLQKPMGRIFKSLPEGFLVLYSSLFSQNKNKPLKNTKKHKPNYVSSSCKSIAN